MPGDATPDFTAELGEAGFSKVRAELHYFEETRVISEPDLAGWFNATGDSLYAAAMRRYMEAGEIQAVKALLLTRVIGKPLSWKKPVAFITGEKPAG